MTDDKIRAEAVEALARETYRDHASQSSPPWEKAPPMVQFQVREACLGTINKVLRLVRPADAEADILRMHLELLADEIQGKAFLSGPQLAKALRELAQHSPIAGEEG